MRKIITIVFVSLIPFLWSCNHDTKNDFELPTTKEYNEIICEILKQDTTFSKPEEKISISSYLLKNRIRLYLSADSSAIPYMPLDPNISIWTLMLYHLTNPVDFKYDSLYLSRQNQLENNVIVEEKCADFLFFSENEVSKKNELRYYNQILFTVPILNYDKKVAFVRSAQLNSCIPDEKIYILKKINRSWKLLERKTR